MALFKKKDELTPQQIEQQKQAVLQRQQALSPFEIHVMPKKFSATSETMVKTGESKKGRIVMVIVVVFVILGLLAFGAWQLYNALNAPVTPPVNQPVNV